MDDEDRVYEAEDIHGNTIYKTEISMSIGNLHDTSSYLCSKDCYETYAVVKKL